MSETPRCVNCKDPMSICQCPWSATTVEDLVAKLRPDAARYRFLNNGARQSALRKKDYLHVGIIYFSILPWEPLRFDRLGERLDAAIDADMAKGRAKV